MARIRILSQLQDALDSEMSWRIKEIADFRLVIKRQPSSAQTFVRAGIALIYAHWEGFIKSASEVYLEFVESQGLAYRELKTCFGVLGLKSQLALLGDSRKSVRNVETLNFVLTHIDKPARMRISSAIDTESNLTSAVFSNIAASLDISYVRYETKFKLIDESLVKRRNSVAHGEYLDIDSGEFMSLAQDVLQLMREYKTDIENAASLHSYRRQPLQAAKAPATI